MGNKGKGVGRFLAAAASKVLGSVTVELTDEKLSQAATALQQELNRKADLQIDHDTARQIVLAVLMKVK
jgi:hypothetical protein